MFIFTGIKIDFLGFFLQKVEFYQKSAKSTVGVVFPFLGGGLLAFFAAISPASF